MSVVLVLVAVAACFGPPRIDRLTVTPTEVCPNDTVEASWSANGATVHLRQDPVMSLAAARSSEEGVQGLSGYQDFDVVLEARAGGQVVVRRRYVHVINESWTFTLTGPPQCRDGEIRVDVDFHMADSQIDGRMQLLSVSPRADRPLTIAHAGLPPVTVPLASTAVFEGKPLAGLWTLTAALKPGESCVAGQGTVPLTPSVVVSGTCDGMPARLPGGAKASDGAPRCGNLGQACCQNATCEGAYRCDVQTARCWDPRRPAFLTTGLRCNGMPATPLSRGYYVGVRDANGCGEVVTQLADSREEAEACVPQAPGPALGSTSIRRYDFCRGGRVRVFVPAFSKQDAEQCVRHLWPNVSLEPGLCRRD